MRPKTLTIPPKAGEACDPARTGIRNGPVKPDPKVVKALPLGKKAVQEPAKATKKINCQLPGAELLKEGKSVEEVMAVLDKEMKPEHDHFCREYILDDNATRSYQRAYPNSGYFSAANSAADLLKKPEIKKRIDQLRDERNKRLEISSDKVLRRVEARASFNPRELYHPDGSFIPIHELHPDVAIGIKSIEVDEIFVGRGEERTAIGITRKITCFDGKASDELLGRNLSLWKDVGSKENPFTIDKLSDEQLEARLAELRSKL